MAQTIQHTDDNPIKSDRWPEALKRDVRRFWSDGKYMKVYKPDTNRGWRLMVWNGGRAGDPRYYIPGVDHAIRSGGFDDVYGDFMPTTRDPSEPMDPVDYSSNDGGGGDGSGSDTTDSNGSSTSDPAEDPDRGLVDSPPTGEAAAPDSGGSNETAPEQPASDSGGSGLDRKHLLIGAAALAALVWGRS